MWEIGTITIKVLFGVVVVMSLRPLVLVVMILPLVCVVMIILLFCYKYKGANKVKEGACEKGSRVERERGLVVG